jgi:hypothetical protein
MTSTRREDIRDFVDARLRKRFFLAKAYAVILGKKIGRDESEEA